MKANLRVVYVDEFGTEEKGIDAGGIFKEFINDLSKIVFDPNYGMFKITENHQQLYPNAQSK
jgi:ubiquitin-protein ligase E3 C